MKNIFAQQSLESEIADAMETIEDKNASFDQEIHDYHQALKLIAQAAEDLSKAGKIEQANVLKNTLESLAKKKNKGAKNPGKTKDEKEMYRMYGYNANDKKYAK